MDRLSAWDDELRGDNCSCFTTGKGPAVEGVPTEQNETKKKGMWEVGQRDAGMWDKVKCVSPSQRLYSPTFLWSIHGSPIWVEGILPWSKPWAGLCNCTGVPWRTRTIKLSWVIYQKNRSFLSFTLVNIYLCYRASRLGRRNKWRGLWHGEWPHCCQSATVLWQSRKRGVAALLERCVG